ncbi:MAG: DUF3365 domain-containing protein [Flavobacteriales bacterium]|nr:DUF3365 domain-containing protein [Flavobacteriales bacterium]
MKTTLFLALSAGVILASCGNDNPAADVATTSVQVPDSVLAEGFHLLENNCFSCHHPNAANEVKVAPNMAEIVSHYRKTHVDYSAFTETMVAFLRGGKPEMSAALSQYGPMPSASYSAQQFKAITAYLWQSDITASDWFGQTYPNEQHRYAEANDMLPVERGLQYVMATKSVLGKNLLAAIKNYGTAGAVDFCSTRAIPITDSMAQHSGVLIKRVSDRNRNPMNKANGEEEAFIEACRASIESGEKPVPLLVSRGDRHIGYYPILTDDMCLQCHGTKEKEIDTATLKALHEKYPDDLATGFSKGDLRGIWVVDMPAESGK